MRKTDFTGCQRLTSLLLQNVVFNESLFRRDGDDTRVRELVEYCRSRNASEHAIKLAVSFELKSIRRVCFVAPSRVTPDLDNFPNTTDVGLGVFASVRVEKGETFYEVITVGDKGILLTHHPPFIILASIHHACMAQQVTYCLLTPRVKFRPSTTRQIACADPERRIIT